VDVKDETAAQDRVHASFKPAKIGMRQADDKMEIKNVKRRLS